ncbi:hypothetical protein AAZX31_13G098700 [Glycine max]
MAGVNPEAGGWKAYPSVMETALDSGDGRSHHNMSDDGSVMHFSATRLPSSGQNKVIPSPTQFSILYKGKMCIYEGIPAEKVREIMLIASVSAKSAEMKSGIRLTSFIPKSPSSSQGNSTNLPSPQSVKSSIRRLQDEFPLARRQSLQRFLEKRRNRLANKSPHALTKNVVHNPDKGFSPDDTPDFGLLNLNFQRRDFSPVVLPL